MGNAIHLENFSIHDKDKALDLLSEAELPIEDLKNEKMRNFMVLDLA